MINYDDFKKVELKTAKVLAVSDHPSADRLYVMEIDINGEKRQIVAGVKKYYAPAELVGKNIVVVTNLEPAVIRGVESNGMMLCASTEDKLSVLTLDRDLSSGSGIK